MDIYSYHKREENFLKGLRPSSFISPSPSKERGIKGVR